MSEYTTEESLICLRRLLYYAKARLRTASEDEFIRIQSAIKWAEIKIEEIEDRGW